MFENAPGFMAMLSGPDHVFNTSIPPTPKLVDHRDAVGRVLPRSCRRLDVARFSSRSQ